MPTFISYVSYTQDAVKGMVSWGYHIRLRACFAVRVARVIERKPSRADFGRVGEACMLFEHGAAAP